MKLKIKSSDIWLETLLHQYYLNLEISSDAPISISEETSCFHLSSKELKQNFYLDFPVSISSLIKLLDQMHKSLESNLIKIGEINFCPNKRLCIFKEEEINLTQKETEILLYLYKQETYIDKASLLENIWGYSSGISTHTLESHIYKLRSKFSEKCEIIVSNEEGYKLIKN